MTEKTLFIFTRDFRLRDNLALNSAKFPVIPVFIFNPKQVSESNKYRSDRSVQFMIFALKELASDIKDKGGKLHFLDGDPAKVVAKLLSNHEIAEVLISADYTPFAKKREKSLANVCKKAGVSFAAVHNHMLAHGVLKEDGTPYVKFTPYWRIAKKKVLKPAGSFRGKWSTQRVSGEVKNIDSYILEDRVEIKPWKGVKNYKKNRDLLTKGGSNASPYLKFGVLSPRILWKMSTERAFRRQLIWRDFYMQLLDHYPRNLGHNMRTVKGVRWKTGSDARERFNKWKNGKTGVPLVDAGMNELNRSGYLHNRVRLVVADFLVKHYGVDWRLGEKYFARKLIDYDVSNNNGNWQWVAGTGVDSQPYYRTFNPERQAKRYDPKGEYIAKWLGTTG